jgi:hypothetical protein
MHRRRSAPSRFRNRADGFPAAGTYDRCVPAAYRFVDRRLVPAPNEEAYDVIGEALERSWGDVGR